MAGWVFACGPDREEISNTGTVLFSVTPLF